MENMSLSTILGGGSILITIGFLIFRGKSFKGFKKIFSGGQEGLKKKIESLEVKEVAKIIEVKEAEKKVEKIKEEVNSFIIRAKKEIKETGKITDVDKLMEGFEKW